MTARANVTDRPWSDGIAVYLTRTAGEHRFIVRPGATGMDEQAVIEPGVDPGPSMLLADDMAMVLLDALAAHYRRATDTGNLRADYDAERARVDRLTDALIRELGARG